MTKNAASDVLVSVLVPVHNGERTVARAVESALAQTHHSVEVLVVDDGSSDSSWEVIESLADGDSRVVAVPRSTASGGPATPRNLGVGRSRGAFLALLDQDDAWLPEKLEVQLDRFRDARVGVVYSDCLTTAGVRYLPSRPALAEPPSGDVADALIQQNYVPACTAVFRREVYERVGPFSQRLTSVDDRDFWVRAALHGYWFSYVDEPLAIKDVGPGRLSLDRRRHDELSVTMWQELSAQWPTNPALAEQLRRSRWHLSSSLAREARHAPPRARVATLVRAARLDPTPRNLARLLRLQVEAGS